MNIPNSPHWTLNTCFGTFCTIWVQLGPFVCLTRLDAKWAKLEQNSCHEVASKFFATNAPDPPYWTLNSCFVMFCTIWVQMGPLSCLTKLGPKHTELVQKFVPRTHVEVYHDKCTRSTPLDPKLMFCCVLYCFGAFATIWLPCESRGQTFRASAKVFATKSLQNFAQRMHPIHPIGP